MNYEIRRRVLKSKLIERYLKKRKTNAPPVAEQKNSSPLNLLELKAKKIIEGGNFMIARNLIDPDLGYKMKREAAIDFIRSNWPVNEAAKLLDDLEQVDIIGIQLHSAQFVRNDSTFSVPVFNVGGADISPNFKPFRNIFFDQIFGEAELKFVESPERTYQASYEKISMDIMYRTEVERLLKKTKQIRDNASLGDWKNSMSITSIPDKNLVIVMAGVGERGTGRIGSPKPIIFQTKNTDKLVDFISSNRTLGMNAIFSLLASSELTPEIPFDRSETYYGSDNKPLGPLFIAKAKLVDIDLYSNSRKKSLGKVRRLEPMS